VNGSVQTNSFTVGSGGAQSVWVGGSYTASEFNSSPAIVTPPTTSDFNFLAAQTYLDNLSSSTLSHAGVAVTPASNGTNYVVSPTGSGLFVYNVDASYFTNQNLGFEVNLVTGQSVIVNITGAGAANLTFSKGTVVVYNGNTVNANTTGGVPVLFNIPTATSVSTSNGSLNGSILAPYATFSSPDQTVDGQLFVGSVNGLAETHDQYYDGTIPLTATPEPVTFVLMGAGLVAIGMRRGMKPVPADR
jgi:choice-of-anchor A domain-containing protein